MKLKTLISIFFSILLFSPANANTPQKAVEFFKQYQNLSNTYNEALLEMYSPDVKIIREVVKPTGETVDIVVPSKRFFKELRSIKNGG